MATWNSMKSRITASVRSTNRMNALLSDSLIGRRKNAQKLAAQPEPEANVDAEKADPKMELILFRTNFSMEKVYKIIENTIDDRLTWDRFSRQYDSWRATNFAASLAAEIRDSVKQLNHKRHRVVCLISIIEKQNQGISIRMRHLLDETMDNFVNYIHERPTYFMVVTVFLVNKD